MRRNLNVKGSTLVVIAQSLFTNLQIMHITVTAVLIFGTFNNCLFDNLCILSKSHRTIMSIPAPCVDLLNLIHPPVTLVGKLIQCD